MPIVARVILPLPLPEAFDYLAPEGMVLAVGDHVVAPLGPRMVRGVVAELNERHGINRPLKALLGRVEDPPLPAGVMACCGTVSAGVFPVVPSWAAAGSAPVRTLTVRMIPLSVPVPPCAAVTVSEVAMS